MRARQVAAFIRRRPASISAPLPLRTHSDVAVPARAKGRGKVEAGGVGGL